MSITRIQPGQRMSMAVKHGNTVYLAGQVATDYNGTIEKQTAEVLETIFMPKFTKEDVVALGPRQIYLSLMIDGVGSPPFSAVTIPPIEPPPVSHRDEVIASSRAQFTTPRAGIEKAIMDELTESLESEAPVDARMRKASYGPPGAARKAPSTVAAKKASVRPSAPRAMNEVLADQGSELPAPMPSVGASAPRREAISPAQAPRAPRADFRSQPPRNEARPQGQGNNAPRPRLEARAPQRDERPAPPAAGKSAEDLKAILRNMTANAGKEKQQQVQAKQQDLKGVLANVLGKAPQSAPKPANALPPHAAEDELPPASAPSAPHPAEPAPPAPRPAPQPVSRTPQQPPAAKPSLDATSSTVAPGATAWVSVVATPVGRVVVVVPVTSVLVVVDPGVPLSSTSSERWFDSTVPPLPAPKACACTRRLFRSPSFSVSVKTPSSPESRTRLSGSTVRAHPKIPIPSR